jgi:hypothetical protein
MIRFLFVVVLIVTPTGAEARRRSDLVVDTCSADRSWVAYRTAFNAAVTRRDAPALLRLVADDVSFGSNGTGRAAFARHWGLARPATSRLWREMAEIMSLGCARDRQHQHWAPSMFLDEDAPDDTTYGAQAWVVGAGIPLHAAPSDRSRIIERMSWVIISVPEHDDGRGEWVRASARDYHPGFVRRSQIHSVHGPYAVFVKRRGQWRLAFLGMRD